SITKQGDSRVTPLGAILRRYKLDELPQIFNVLRGDMSLVGPRPEAPTYVGNDTVWQTILSVRPGITDLASITFHDEESLLAEAPDYECAYRELLLPAKLKLAMVGINKRSLRYDTHLVARTAGLLLPWGSRAQGAEFLDDLRTQMRGANAARGTESA